MISEMKDNKIHLVFGIGEYDPEVIDFLTFLEITSKSKATDEDIEELSEEIKRKWWEENKKRFLGEDESGN